MSRLDKDLWQRLSSPEARPLLDACAALRDPESPAPADIGGLRKLGPIELVPVALELLQARRRAARKLEGADSLLCDRQGVEQASGTLVAAHKALRFAALGQQPVYDLCCGIGGDAIALVHHGLEVVAVDRDPTRAMMAGHNAGCRSEVAAVEDFDLPAGAPIHLDPARRVEGSGGGTKRRLWQLADLLPGPVVIERVMADRPAALKLGPGVDLDSIPHPDEREIEIIGGRGGLLQCVVWSGALAPGAGRRTATSLVSGQSFTSRPAEPAMVARATGRYLLLPDPALERAELVSARLDDAPYAELARGLGVFTGDEPSDDPWFECCEILAEMPWREAKLQRWLNEHDAGEVVVRSRAGAVDAMGMARRLRGKGERRFTLFGLRLGKKVMAYVSG